jgi:hypothetical protein
MMTVEDLARSINEDTANFEYFWSYGLIRETYKLWMDEDNKKLLSEDAQNLLSIAEDDPKTIK